MSDVTLKEYKVLRAISFKSDRVEIGSTIRATAAEAKNIGVGDYLKLVDAQGADEKGKKKDDTPKGDVTPPTPPETGPETSENVQPKTIKHIVTEEDLKKNPELVKEGVKVGDEIDVADTAETDESTEGKNTAPKGGDVKK